MPSALTGPNGRVSVSLVTHRSAAHLDACLASVRAQGSLVREILAVDCASPDATVACLREHHADVALYAAERNLGYAAAHNHNFARASGELFLVLNPDVVLRPGALAVLAAALQDPAVGAAGPTLLAPGGSRRLDSAGIVRSRTRFVDRGRGEPAERYARAEPVFGVCGAAALYRSRALRAVSRPRETPFAERFFMYYEDVDLAWRLRRAGFESRFVPGAEAHHLRGGSGARADFVEYHLVRNRLWLTLRNAGLGELARELPGLAAFEAAKLWQARSRPHLRRALRDAWRAAPGLVAERWRGRAASLAKAD